MITYSYKCEACNHEEDIKQRITENSLTKCTACGEDKFNRQIQKPKNAPATVFKGAWFSTNGKY